jgi:hypothetical protein
MMVVVVVVVVPVVVVAGNGATCIPASICRSALDVSALHVVFGCMISSTIHFIQLIAWME